MHTAHRVRLTAILALGAFALHQLRYLIAFGDSSSAELARQGHTYMADALPIMAVFVLSALLATVMRGRYGAGLARASLHRRTSFFAVALFSIYVSQESLEGALAAGHPGGAAAVLAAGGWLAIPLAVALGALVALIAQVLEGVESAIASRRAPRRLRRAPLVQGRALAARGVRLPRSPLAFGFARRPPPPVPA
jgi:hypothetical protein